MILTRPSLKPAIGRHYYFEVNEVIAQGVKLFQFCDVCLTETPHLLYKLNCICRVCSYAYTIQERKEFKINKLNHVKEFIFVSNRKTLLL